MKKIFPLFAVIIVLVLAVCSFHIIPTGYTGVKTSFGQIQETTIQSGKLNFCIPFVQSIHKVNNKQQDKHIEAQVWGEASDKTPVYAADVIVTYQVLPEKSAWLYANVSDIKNLVGDELVASAIKSAMAELGPNEVTNRTKIEPLAQQKLAESLVQKYGDDVVFVNKVVINDMNSRMPITKPSSRSPLHSRTQISRRSKTKPPLPRQKPISRWRSPMQRRKPRRLPLPQTHRQRQTANWQKACLIR